jgi:hypothetical protein
LKIEQFRPLQLGFLAYSKEKVHYGMKDFFQQNREDIKRFDEFSCYIELKDGTKIFGIYNDYCIRGRWFDQLIIYKGAGIPLYKSEIELYENAVFGTKFRSCVPEEYQILNYYDYDKEE